jgi:peptide/nickel transport system substrate-binding protein
MITLAKTNPTSKGWFKSFPWAHPDPTLPAVMLNLARSPYEMKEVRWALTLAIDIVRVAMASYRGCATISGIHVPPTGLYPKYYFDPLEQWLKDFTIDVGGQPYKPWDSEAPKRIAEEARKALGNLVPTDAAEIRKSIGMGWWKYDLKAAETLLLSKGFKRDSNKMWLKPDGQPWKIPLMCEGETRPIMNRAAAMIAECWKEFGIDSFADVRDSATRSNLPSLGEFDAHLSWTIETWGGHPDLFYFLESWHSQYLRPLGERSVARNWMRWKHPELDPIIDQIQKLDFDDPKVLELGRDFVKLCAREQPTIPIMSYNVFSVCDETYWTGFPDAEHPYTNPVANWANTKYMFPKIKPKA